MQNFNCENEGKILKKCIIFAKNKYYVIETRPNFTKKEEKRKKLGLDTAMRREELILLNVIGKSWSINSAGEKLTTLYVSEPFGTYYYNGEGRGAEGEACQSIYVGNMDCSSIKPGTSIEVYYGQAVRTKDGRSFQPVKKIEVID